MQRLFKYPHPSHLTHMPRFAASVVTLSWIITAEAFYPSYSTQNKAICDLGASMPLEIVVARPSAMVFNAAMIARGLLVTARALRGRQDLRMIIEVFSK